MIWGFSLHGWEDVMRGSLAVVGVFGLLVGLATFFVVTLQREEIEQSKRELDEYKIEAAEKVAASVAIGETAKAEAERAKADAAKANLELVKIRTPRGFSFEQITALGEKLKRFEGTRFDMAVLPGDPEAFAFMTHIAAILESAKWTWVEWNHPGGGLMMVFNFADKPNIGQLGFIGVSITAHASHHEFSEPANELFKVLKAEGVEAFVDANTGDTKGVPNNDTIHIIVGQKPR